MTKSIVLVSCLLLLNLSCFGQENREPDNVLDEQSKLIFKVLDEFPNNTQFAIAFVKNGTVEFEGVVKDSNELKTIENKHSVFEIGSISKVFTSTLLANAILEEKVRIDGLVNEHLSFKIHNDYEFGLVQLANHTSGLPRMPGNFIFNSSDPTNPFKDYSEKALIEFLEVYIKLEDDMSISYEYSNLGAGLLGYALTKIYNKSYSDLLSDKIFMKYDMVNSNTNSKKVKSLLAQGLDDKGNPTSNWDLNVLVGAGGILSNVEDMSKFMLAQFNTDNKELNLTRKQTFSVSDKTALGLGWHIKKDSSLKDLVWHNGATGGYRSCMVFDVESNDGIVVLSNISGFHKSAGKIDKLAFDLLKKQD